MGSAGAGGIDGTLFRQHIREGMGIQNTNNTRRHPMIVVAVYVNSGVCGRRFSLGSQNSVGCPMLVNHGALKILNTISISHAFAGRPGYGWAPRLCVLSVHTK